MEVSSRNEVQVWQDEKVLGEKNKIKCNQQPQQNMFANQNKIPKILNQKEKLISMWQEITILTVSGTSK